MILIFIILSLLTLFLAVATLLPVLANEVWWVRGFDFPRFQFSVMAIIILFCNVFFLDLSLFYTWLLIVVNSGCLMYQLWWILPYTKISPKEVEYGAISEDTESCVIMTANVLTPNRKAEELLELVEKYSPDILVTLESDFWWQKHLDTLEESYPYTIKCPLDNLYGMHVYSRLLLEESNIFYLVEPDVPSMHAKVVFPSGEKVRVHFLHPAPPSPTENESSKERDAELLMIAQNVEESELPVIVTGDLNDVAWSSTTRLFRKISGLLDPRVGRGMFNTYHAGYWFIRWPLDHLFHSSHFKVHDIKRLPAFGSDHFALVTHLIYVPGDTNQKGLESAKDDQLWAEKKMEQKEVSQHDVPNLSFKTLFY